MLAEVVDSNSPKPTPSLIVLACGALARELRHLPADLAVSVHYLPSHLHNRPADIPAALDAALAGALPAAGSSAAPDSAPLTADVQVYVAYADCGTAGQLDRWCQEHNATRLPGAHCYELLLGGDRFAELMEHEPGTFFLTDYLALHFDALVLGGLGIAAHPELMNQYFGNYRRVVHLAQDSKPEAHTAARHAAAALGLELVTINTGRETLLGPIARHVQPAAERLAPAGLAPAGLAPVGSAP